ncbi:hypothetical protein M0Q97_13685 [Candidatus Dojkabacteria bacterium]|jgi:hypothetical protein|nr:hypothetical protein [Candidatus Dojkabacteria bacterium]
MNKIFKKVKATNTVTVEDIHESFFTEVDRLLEEARISHSLESDKLDLIDKCDRLEKLGFSQSQEVREAKLEIQRLNELKTENAKKEELIDAINYFSQKYPLYKFITEESVKKICEKYGLIYSEVNNYIGTIPYKNLKEMENFKISDDDIPVNVTKQNFNLRWNSNNSIMSANKVKFDFGSDIGLTNNYFKKDDDYYNINKIPLYIAAPIKDFNTKNMEIKEYKLDKPQIVQDPIVLQPVFYKQKQYFLIMTAWGEEASDENVVNQNFN